MTLYLMRLDGEPVGYGLVRGSWVTGGLIQEVRGQGLGRALFRFLTEEAFRHGGSAYLDVLGANYPALNLYKSLGYEVIGSGDGLVTMRKEKPT